MYFLKVKSDAGIAFRDFVAMVEAQFNTRVKSFLTDGGGEYVNGQLMTFLSAKGIIHIKTPPYQMG